MGKNSRKKYTAQEKFALVYESYVTGDLQGTASRHGVHVNMLNKWRSHMKAHGSGIFERGIGKGKSQEDQRIEQLEKIIGRQAIQIEVLKKTEELLNSGR
jgi:transposase-like protein